MSFSKTSSVITSYYVIHQVNKNGGLGKVGCTSCIMRIYTAAVPVLALRQVGCTSYIMRIYTLRNSCRYHCAVGCTSYIMRIYTKVKNKK